MRGARTQEPGQAAAVYFGAVRIRDGRFVFRREEGSFDTVTCHAFLRQLWQATRGSGRRAVVIADNAGYHHARLIDPGVKDARIDSVST